MNISNKQEIWISQAQYAKQLRPLLPPEAFLPDSSKIWLILINIGILLLGWRIASYLPSSDWYLDILFLPLSLIMGNSIIVLLFSTHDLLHSSTIRNPFLRQVIGFLGLTMLWTPPTLWKVVHNQEHHNKTNSLQDPDRNYLYSQPQNWGKWIQNLFVPSSKINPFWLVIGIANAWGVHTFRNLSSVVFFNDGLTKYTPTSFQVTAKVRKNIIFELLAITGIHAIVLAYLGLHPFKLILSYFLPIWIGYSGIMFYVFTNHMLCRMTETNDPLVNSISLRVPKLFDLLHLNFSYHTEHHIFPSMNSNYYPLVRELLLKLYPERFNLLNAGKAWQLLLQTPRHYKDENTFTDWSGKVDCPCPLSAQHISE